MCDEWTEADDVIEEIWEIRRKIWERFDNDPEKVIAYYMELEKQHVGPRVEPSAEGQDGKARSLILRGLSSKQNRAGPAHGSAGPALVHHPSIERITSRRACPGSGGPATP